MKSREIIALEESLEYHFQRHELLEQALTHSSQAREVEALGIMRISNFWETPCSGS
jgi:dsRNA-specific ribonuclease